MKFLQRACGQAYSGKIDGVVGPKTLTAVGLVPSVLLINTMLDARMAFLRKHEDWPTFGKGWTNRVNAVRNFPRHGRSGAGAGAVRASNRTSAA